MIPLPLVVIILAILGIALVLAVREIEDHRATIKRLRKEKGLRKSIDPVVAMKTMKRVLLEGAPASSKIRTPFADWFDKHRVESAPDANVVIFKTKYGYGDLTGLMPGKAPGDAINRLRAQAAEALAREAEEEFLGMTDTGGSMGLRTSGAAEEAIRITDGDRNRNYGHPLEDFEATAQFWTTYLRRKYGIAPKLGPEDVPEMMVLLKTSRECEAVKRDNTVDRMGYLRTMDSVYTELGHEEYATEPTEQEKMDRMAEEEGRKIARDMGADPDEDVETYRTTRVI